MLWKQLQRLWQNLQEFTLVLSGNRKAGAYNSIDSRDYILSELPVLRKDKDLSEIDNRSWRQTFQGATTKCVLFSTCKVLSGVISLYHQQKLDFDPDELKVLMGDKYVEGKGCYIRDAVATLKEHGLHDQFGRLWKIGAYVKIPAEQFIEAHKKGFPIITGSFGKAPFCDANWFWRTASMADQRGHSTVACGLAVMPEGNIHYGDNHWNLWGLRVGGKATSRFFWKESQLYKLFTSFTFIDPVCVDE